MGRSPYLSTKNMRDAHLVVVDDICEVVGGEAVRLAQDKVLDRDRVVFDGVIDKVVLHEAVGAALEFRGDEIRGASAGTRVGRTLNRTTLDSPLLLRSAASA